MSTSVSDAYPELMHYTTAAGLRGIISSGCLWATDAAHLNDESEISHFFDVRLPGVIAQTVRQRGIEIARTPNALAEIIQQGGFENVVQRETRTMVRNLKEVTLSMNRPFVLSLCGASDQRIAENGLLSQWRGYGSDGGFAIVFDTAALEDALRDEADQHHYMHIQMGDVFYEGIDPTLQPAASDFDELEEIVRTGVARLLRGGKAEETSRFYEAVTSLSCLCKHWGFWEEREVRVVVVPASQEVLDGAPDEARAPPTVRTFPRGASQIPYLELFSTPGPRRTLATLPIKRVIVGPHRARDDRVAEAEGLLSAHGYAAAVGRSEIPYVGR